MALGKIIFLSDPPLSTIVYIVLITSYDYDTSKCVILCMENLCYSLYFHVSCLCSFTSHCNIMNTSGLGLPGSNDKLTGGGEEKGAGAGRSAE